MEQQTEILLRCVLLVWMRSTVVLFLLIHPNITHCFHLKWTSRVETSEVNKVSKKRLYLPRYGSIRELMMMMIKTFEPLEFFQVWLFPSFDVLLEYSDFEQIWNAATKPICSLFPGPLSPIIRFPHWLSLSLSLCVVHICERPFQRFSSEALVSLLTDIRA